MSILHRKTTSICYADPAVLRNAQDGGVKSTVLANDDAHGIVYYFPGQHSLLQFPFFCSRPQQPHRKSINPSTRTAM